MIIDDPIFTRELENSFHSWRGIPDIEECIMYWNDCLAYCYYCQIEYLESFD